MRNLILSAAIFVTVLYFSPSPGVASPEYARRTQKDCNYCHPPANYTLTNAGKYYQAHKTLKGYQPKDEPKKPDAGQQSGKGQ